MKNLIWLCLLVSALMLTSFSYKTSAQVPYRVSDSQVQQLLTQLEQRTDIFRRSLAREFNRSRFYTSTRESEINGYVQEFDQATNQLRDRFNSRQSVSAEVDEVLARGWHIDHFMRTNRLGGATERDWAAVRANLQTLARYYNVRWRWNDRAYNPATSRYDDQSRDRYARRPGGGSLDGNLYA
jgi:hypothetical protein